MIKNPHLYKDPHILKGPQPRSFWADSVAEKILERGFENHIVIKGGISPSGVPHLGNMNEVARGYFVAEALRKRNYTVEQVFTTDDRDPLRKLPRKLADLNGNIVSLGEVNAGVLGRNLGKPYTAVPDPFGCCDSYGAHFSNLIKRSAELLDIPIEMRSNTQLYESGEFEDVTRYLLAHRKQARNELAKYQDKVNDDYVPFRPICGKCGHVTETDSVRSVDLDAGTVEYVCTDIEAGGRTIEGCGYNGTATFRDGKLPWRFEWPAQWSVLNVDFEPFGKDHAEGSWPSGFDIAKEVLKDATPVPMAYEWFTLDGEAFSSSEGRVIMIHDVLELLEPEVLRYFFTKDPTKARDFSIKYLDQLVSEFDEFERIYYQEMDSGPRVTEEADSAYPPTISPIWTSSEMKRKYLHIDLTINSGKKVGLNRHFRINNHYFSDTTEMKMTSDNGIASDDKFDMFMIRQLTEPDRKWQRSFGQEYKSTTYDLDFSEDISDTIWSQENLRKARRNIVDTLFNRRIRLPYTFAAVLGMTDNRELREEMAQREDHIPPNAPDWAIENALARVEYARTWAERTDNAYNYRLAADLPPTDFDSDTKAALCDLARVVETGSDGEEIQSEVFETARAHDLDPGELFTAGYRLFFDTEQGPKLGPFLAELDREFVVKRLRREA